MIDSKLAQESCLLNFIFQNSQSFPLSAHYEPYHQNMADIFLIAGTHRSYQPGDLLPRVRGHPWRGRQALRLGAAPGIIIDETCHCIIPQCPQGHLLNCVDTAGDCLTGLVMLTHNILVTASGTGLSCFKAKKEFNKNLSQALVSWCGT